MKLVTEFTTHATDGSIEKIRRIYHDHAVEVTRNEDGTYSYSILSQQTYDNAEEALFEARDMIEESWRKNFSWVPLVNFKCGRK